MVLRDGTPLRVYGAGANAAVVLVPGLHFNGIYDFRLDRLARGLAASGLLVVCPDIASHRRLRASGEAAADVDAAFDEAQVRTGSRALGFSISFGCLPLLQAAAARDEDSSPAALVVFGGYGSWADTIRFALTGRRSDGRVALHDPLNAPVVVGNLLAGIDTAAARVPEVERAWLRYVQATWGREEMKAGGWRDVAERLAATLAPQDRELFRLGCNVDAAAVEPVNRALATDRWRHLDPLPAAAQIRCPVRIVHGQADDVIPIEQADVLASGFTQSPDVRVLKTGLYSHTGGGMPDLRALVREARILLKLVDALARLPRRRH